MMEAIADQFPTTDKDFPEVSIIMPCLNEADTLAACIGKARRALNEQQIDGEIVVADNGSTDGSQGYRDEVPRPPGQRGKNCLLDQRCTGRWCRWPASLCSRLPLGAQYQVLCRKPS